MNRHGTAPVDLAPSPAGRRRDLWADNLRVIVVSGVIVAHTATGYISDVADWYYEELSTSEVSSTVLAFPIAAGALFGLGPLFLLAGWYTPRSLAHRGPASFARSRLVRLGVPLVAFALVVQPLTDYIGTRRDEVRPSLVDALGDTELSVMWFVAALLAFSLVYAAWRAGRPARAQHQLRSLGSLLTIAAITIAIASLLVWQLWAWNSNALRTARLGEWPQAAVLFALGVNAAEAGWLEHMTTETRRRLGWVAVIGTVATVALFGMLDATGRAEAVLDDADGWPVVLFAALDGLVAVSLTVWFVAWFRDRPHRRSPLLARAAGASYATYLPHPPVVTSLMVLLAPVALAPEAKFVLVSGAGVAASFTLGYAITRAPGFATVVGAGPSL
jgi:hypothetical protein